MELGSPPAPQAQPMETIITETIITVQPAVMTAPGVPMAQTMLAPQMGMPVAQAVDEQTLMAEAKMREAEQRAQRAEVAMQLQAAEMRARAAEQALAQQTRMAALEKALRDADKCLALAAGFAKGHSRRSAELEERGAEAAARDGASGDG